MKSVTTPVETTCLIGKTLLVCQTAANGLPIKPAIGAIYKLHNGRFEAVPFDDPRIARFNDPHSAQKHIEECKNL